MRRQTLSEALGLTEESFERMAQWIDKITPEYLRSLARPHTPAERVKILYRGLTEAGKCEDEEERMEMCVFIDHLVTLVADLSQDYGAVTLLACSGSEVPDA